MDPLFALGIGDIALRTQDDAIFLRILQRLQAAFDLRLGVLLMRLLTQADEHLVGVVAVVVVVMMVLVALLVLVMVMVAAVLGIVTLFVIVVMVMVMMLILILVVILVMVMSAAAVMLLVVIVVMVLMLILVIIVMMVMAAPYRASCKSREFLTSGRMWPPRRRAWIRRSPS